MTNIDRQRAVKNFVNVPDYGREEAETDSEEEYVEDVKTLIHDKLEESFDDPNATWLSEVARPFSDREKGLSNTMHQNADIFFDELITLVKEKREKYPTELRSFLSDMRDVFFSHSPSISNYLRTEDILIYSAKVSRVEEMRGFVGQDLVGEFVYELSFSDRDISKSLINKIDQLPDGERADVINQIETMFANAVANGEWSESSLYKLVEVVEHFSRYRKPLTRIIAQVALERMQEEEDNPSLSIFTYADSKSGGRLNSLGQDLNVGDKCINNLPMGYKAIVVSNDTVLGVDNAGMPRYGAEQKDAPEILTKEDLGLRKISLIKAIEGVDNFKQIDVRRLINLIGPLSKDLNPEVGVDEFFAHILGISVEEMNILLDTRADVTPYFEKDWKGVRYRIMDWAYELEDQILEKNNQQLDFKSFEEVADSDNVSPFGSMSDDEKILVSQFMRPEVREKLMNELGIDLLQISFRAQVNLIRFLSKESDDTFEKLKEVLERFPNLKHQLLEVFVGCSEDLNFGNEFLEFCESLEEAELVKFLDSYIGVINASGRLNNLLRSDEDAKRISKETSTLFKQNIITRARDILYGWQDKEEEALKHQQELLIFSATFRSLRSTEGLKVFDIMKNVSFETITGDQFNKQDVRVMDHIFDENYSSNIGLRDLVKESFHQRLENPEVNFYVVRNEGRIISFLSLQPSQNEKSFHQKFGRKVDDNETYFGSFNSYNGYKGGTVGDTLMRKVLDREAETKIIHATSTATLPISAKYIEDGFIATRNFQDHGESIFEIVRDDSLKFKACEMSKEDIVSLYLRHSLEMEEPDGDLVIKQADFQDRLDFSLLDDDFVLTRYFQNTNDSKWYAVFERVKESEQEE